MESASNIINRLEKKDKAQGTATEFANVPVELTDKIVPEIKGLKAPTIDDILDGKEVSIGNEELNPNLIRSAMEGDVNSINRIVNKINTYNRKQQKKPPIAGVVMGDDLMPRISEAPRGLTDEQKDNFRKYQDNRLAIYNSLRGAKREDGTPMFTDNKVINLLTKFYSTGEFFTETNRQLSEIPRAFGEIPTLINLGISAIDAGTDAAFSDVTYADAWAKQQPSLAYNAARIKGIFNKFGASKTFAEAVDKDIKQKYIDQHGQVDFDSSYRPIGANDQPLNLRMIDEEQGRYLLNYGFGELPLYQQFGERVFENALFSVPFARLGLMKGKKDYDLVKKLRKDEPKLYNPAMTNIEVLRTYKINNATNAFTKSWARFSGNVGRAFRSEGNVGSYSTNLEYGSAMKANREAIKQKRLELNRALSRKNTKKGKIDELQGELMNLQNVNNQLLLKSLGTGDRFTFSVLGAELPIAAFQATAGYYHEKLGVSRDTAELFGIVAGVTGGPQWLTRKAFGLGQKVTGLVGPVNEVLMSGMRLFEDVVSIIPEAGVNVINKVTGKSINPIGIKGLFVDRRFDDLAKLTGQPLDEAQKESFQRLATIMKDMPIEQRENVFKALNDYKTTRNRILKMFDAGKERDQASEVFSLTFAHASGLAPLQMLDRISANKINVNNPDWEKLAQHQLEAENANSVAELGISKLLRMIQQKEKMNPQDRAYGIAFAKGMQDAVNGHKIIMADRRQDLLNLVRDYTEQQLTNPGVAMPDDILQKIINHKLLLRPELLGDSVAQKQVLLETVTTLRTALNERASLINSMRASDEKTFQMGRLVEDMYDLHIENNYLLGKSFYKKAEDIAAKRPPVDVSSIAEKLLLITQDLKAKDLGYFFSNKSRFFNGRVGKLTMKAFNNMAEKSLKRAGLKDTDIQELKTYFLNAKDPTDAAVGANFSMMHMALHLKNVGMFTEGGRRTFKDLNPFQASAFELEEMRRFFVNLERKEKDAGLKKEYTKFIKKIDDSFATDPELDKAIQEARDKYRDLIFDPKRQGSIGERIENSRLGPERVIANVDETRYKYSYPEGFTPEEWHKDVAEGIVNVMDNRPNASRELQMKIQDLAYYWSDRSETGELIFDLTTKDGKAKFENLQNLLKMQFYEHWGTMRENLVGQLMKGLDKNDAYDALTTPVTSELTVGGIRRLQKIQEGGTFEVTVKTIGPDGKPRPDKMNLLNLEEIISADNDITNLLQLSKKAREEYKKLAKELNDSQSDVMRNAQVVVDMQSEGLRTMEKLVETKDPAQFFEKIIAQGTADDVIKLRERFILNRLEFHKQQGGDVSPTALREVELKSELEFKEGMIYFITQGLISRAGMSKSTIRKLKTLDGTVMPHTEMTNAAQFFSDVANDRNKEIFELFFDDKHIEYLEDLGDFMRMASGAANVKYGVEGIVRNISPNELISRAFNLARGMVGLPYVGAELAARLAMGKNIELIGLAIRNKEAADIMNTMMETPEKLTLDQVKKFGTLLKAHVAQELLKQGIPAVNSEYLSQNEMNRYERLTSMELMENPPEEYGFMDKIFKGLTYPFVEGGTSEAVQ